MEPQLATMLEIERKFLVRRLPEDLERYPCSAMEQGYLVSSENGTQVRLRRIGDKFLLAFKRGRAGEVREEREIELTRKQFDALWPATEGKRLEKIRYEVPYEGHLVEIDFYRGRHEGLVVAEVEFADEKTCADFRPPDWLGEDVTGDPRFSNQLLAST